MQSLLNIIHKENPYTNFNNSFYVKDDKILEHVKKRTEELEYVFSCICKFNTKRIFEVGSFLGASAIVMSEVCKKNFNIKPEIVCIDTWLGSIDHWFSDEYRNDLKIKNGYPNIFYQFLGNVLRFGHQDCIVPFPCTSLDAAKFFLKEKITADIVYIDGAHDYDSVLRDCFFYYDVLNPGGVLFGDDFHISNRDVMTAVQDFVVTKKVKLLVSNAKWIVNKPITL